VELRDYVRMLRRGWPTIVLITALATGLAAAYLVIAPKRYEATAVLFVSAGSPRSAADLQQGVQFSGNAVATFADIIDSAVVLAPVADQLRPQLDLDELMDMVTTASRQETSLIDITVTGSSAAQVAEVANSAAASAIRVIPTLIEGRSVASPVRLQAIQRAMIPTEPLSPDVKRVLALGLVIGIVGGLGVTIVSQTLDTRLRREEDLRRVTDVPLLAVLPHLKRSQRHRVVVRDAPTGRAGEAYRSLRTNLTHLEADSRRSLMFTSVTHDRDGARVPINLAWSIAQAGRRVLLIDMDLRQSAIGAALYIRPGLGLADVLAGELPLSNVIQQTTHEKLHVVLSGTVQPSPSDLLSAPIMSTVLREAEINYDYVVLHAPPLLTYTDAAVVSRVTGWTLVAVSAGRTRAPDLVTALGTLANVRVKPLGLVLVGARGATQDNRRLRGVRPVLPPSEHWPLVQTARRGG